MDDGGDHGNVGELEDRVGWGLDMDQPRVGAQRRGEVLRVGAVGE